jgi:hypothetical protein
MNRALPSASLCAVVLLLAGCGNAAGSAEADALVKAADALEAKVGAPGEKAQMPAADDPDVRAFDAQAGKALTDLGTPAMPAGGFDSYERLCVSAAKITGAYVSAGLGAIGDGGLPLNDPAKVAKMNENGTRYMNQMFVPLLYSAHCTAVHLPGINKELDGKDLSGKAESIAKVRGGAYGQAAGLLQMAAGTDLGADKRKQVLDVLARDAADFGTAFTPEQKQALVQAAQQIGAADAKAKPQTDRFAADLQKAPCGKLCSI